MKVIKSAQDIACLRSAGALQEEYIKFLEKEFNTTVEAYGGIKHWNPSLHGYLVVLEKGDNVRDLSVVGLNPEDQGLLGIYPEWIDLINLSGLFLYKILVIYSNDYAVQFYCQVGQFDDEVEKWLRENIH